MGKVGMVVPYTISRYRRKLDIGTSTHQDRSALQCPRTPYKARQSFPSLLCNPYPLLICQPKSRYPQASRILYLNLKKRTPRGRNGFLSIREVCNISQLVVFPLNERHLISCGKKCTDLPPSQYPGPVHVYPERSVGYLGMLMSHPVDISLVIRA